MTRRQVEHDQEDVAGRAQSQQADRDGPSFRPRDGIAAVQRSLGNQAVQQLADSWHAPEGVTVSRPGDPAEREAERVAESVIQSQREPVTRTEADGSIRSRLSTGAVTPANQVRDHPTESFDGRGQQLPGPLRSAFGSRFARDFSDVRIHTGSKANDSARSINAEAYTIGRDIVFSQGAYRPETPGGQRLLAHELTHVMQKDRGQTNIQRQRSDSQGASREENLDATERGESLTGDCPSGADREPGEYEWANKRGFKVVSTEELSLASGASSLLAKYSPGIMNSWVLYGFSIGSDTAKSSREVLSDLIEPYPTHLSVDRVIHIYGFSDCHGGRELNQRLRQGRADEVRLTLPTTEDTEMGFTEGAQIGTYIAPNTTKRGRERNRAVLIIDRRAAEKGDLPEEENWDEESKSAIEEAKAVFAENGEEKYLKFIEYFQDPSKNWNIWTVGDVITFANEYRRNHTKKFKQFSSNGRDIMKGNHPPRRGMKFDYFADCSDTEEVRGSIHRFITNELADGITELKNQLTDTEGDNPERTGPELLAEHLQELSQDDSSIYYLMRQYPW